MDIGPHGRSEKMAEFRRKFSSGVASVPRRGMKNSANMAVGMTMMY